MTFNEALQALQRAQNVTWSASFEYNDLSIFDELTQAIEVFKRMNEDLIQRLDGLYNIGDKVIDEDGCKGYVCIRYEDGDCCSIENDAAHPNPKKTTIPDFNIEIFLDKSL